MAALGILALRNTSSTNLCSVSDRPIPSDPKMPFRLEILSEVRCPLNSIVNMAVISSRAVASNRLIPPVMNPHHLAAAGTVELLLVVGGRHLRPAMRARAEIEAAIDLRLHKEAAIEAGEEDQQP